MVSRRRDPFKPTAGSNPPVLVGRSGLLQDIADAYTGSPGAAEWFTLFVGPRGVGKTVMLNAIEDEAKKLSWQVFAETATGGFIDRLTVAIMRATASLLEIKSVKAGMHMKKLSVAVPALGRVEFERESQEAPDIAPDFRTALTQLCLVQEQVDEQFGQNPTGILITLDELHRNSRSELVAFATAIQHMIREDRPVAVAMAGIPSAVEPLLASDADQNPITFLRRADRHSLGRIPDAEVRQGLAEPVQQIGMKWEDAALTQATAACGGYAFMIQLVGSWCVRCAQTETIDLDAARQGIDKAQARLGQLVHEPALADLSDLDRSFLVAMAKDDGSSKISDIAQRLHRSAQQTNTYRQRLLQTGLIEQSGYGLLNFSLPYLRTYLREHFTNQL